MLLVEGLSFPGVGWILEELRKFVFGLEGKRPADDGGSPQLSLENPTFSAIPQVQIRLSPFAFRLLAEIWFEGRRFAG